MALPDAATIAARRDICHRHLPPYGGALAHSRGSFFRAGAAAGVHLVNCVGRTKARYGVRSSAEDVVLCISRLRRLIKSGTASSSTFPIGVAR